MYEIEFTDMERAPMGKVFERLRCGTNGLSTKEAEERLELFGPNKFKKTDQESDMVKFFRFMWNPISLAMEFTAIMSLVLANGGGKPTDWEDFVGIIVLLLFNTTTSFIVEKEACSVSDALMAHLAPKTKVLRDGKWVKDDVSNLVPGDIIRITAGDKIPADCRVLEGEPLEIDESALTGESFPATERSGDIVYCGSICKQGETEAVVIATGVHTLYCNAAPVPVDSRNQEDRCLQKALTTVGNLCLWFIFAGLYLEILSIGPVPKRGYRAVIDNLLVLLIGGIPIAMPTVFSVLMATASLRLSEQGVIIKRVSAIEEIGSMDVLFIDKTRTLTMNKLEVFAETVEPEDVPEGTKESPGDPWQLIGLIPLLDSVSNESAETIRRTHDLGVNVKMITGDQLAIAKETGRGLGLGTNMYPATPLLTGYKYSDLIEVADGYSSVSPEQRNEIVKHLQDKRHICGITGDTIDDVPALERANISIAVADATDAARRASDILLTKPGLSEIISVILTSRAISQKMKNCAVYAISITVSIVLCFFLITVIWDFNFPPFMALVIAVLNYGTMKTIIKDKVKPSPKPDNWKMEEIFTTGIVLGVYLAMMTVVFFWTAYETEFFPRTFKVTSLHKNDVKDFKMLASAVFLQVSTISQALIFVTRTRAELAGVYLVSVSVATHMEMTTVIAVYADWGFACIEGIGWRWAGVILLYNLICYIPLVPLKLFVRYVLNERKDNFEREELQRRWAHALRNLHGRDNDGIQQREDEDEDDAAMEDEQAHFLPHL